jgi:hypothetical protein
MTNDDPILRDNGFYFDTRPGTPPVYHFRVACEAGMVIPRDDRQHTYDLSDLGGRRACPECNEATAVWEALLRTFVTTALTIKRQPRRSTSP